MQKDCILVFNFEFTQSRYEKEFHKVEFPRRSASAAAEGGWKMKQEEKSIQKPDWEPDRMGIYIGKLRTALNIPRSKLAEGLCSESHLARIESGEREAEKLLLDALLERLGCSAEMFERILDQEEENGYQLRTNIARQLREGKLDPAKVAITAYEEDRKRHYGKKWLSKESALERQFLQMMKINLDYLEHGLKESLYDFIEETIRMTQPRFETVPLTDLLLGRNEIYLILALLESGKRLKIAEKETVSYPTSYLELLEYLKVHIRDRQERIHVSPYAACQAAREFYEIGRLEKALEKCREACSELGEEQKLFCQDRLLKLEQDILQALGSQETTSERIRKRFQEIREYVKMPEPLWLPYEENHDNHGANEVLKSRRRLLKLSQESMAGVPGDPSIWRYEKKAVRPQRRNRRRLLQQVGLSGERYDYEIITTNHEDYLLRSRLGRAVNQKKWEQAKRLLEELSERVPDTRQNRQYLETHRATIQENLPNEDRHKISLEERISRLQKALAMTLPGLPIKTEETELLAEHPAGMLSLNESIILKQLATCYKRQGKLEESLQVLRFLKRCLEYDGSGLIRDIEQYTLCIVAMVSVLGDCGYYEESNELGRKCIQLMLERQTSVRMAECLFGIAWNMEQQRLENLELYTGKKGEEQKERCLALFHMAYAAAIWSGYEEAQRHLKKYCMEICGIELEL